MYYHHIHQGIDTPEMFHFSTLRDTLIFLIYACVVIHISLSCIHINDEIMPIVVMGRWYSCIPIVWYQLSLSLACFQVACFNIHIMSIWKYISEAVSKVIIPYRCCNHLRVSSMLSHNSCSGHDEFVFAVVSWSLSWVV